MASARQNGFRRGKYPERKFRSEDRHGAYLASCIIAAYDSVEEAGARLCLFLQRVEEAKGRSTRWGQKHKEQYRRITAVIEAARQFVKKWMEELPLGSVSVWHVAALNALKRYHAEKLPPVPKGAG